MASDDYIAPASPGSSELIHHPKNQNPPDTTLVLERGDVAVVSTVEKICIPWDLFGLLGINFSLAAEGVLVFTGLYVDPGYGLKQNNGKWLPQDDYRLHFILVNLGPKKVALKLGEKKIAKILFVQAESPMAKETIISSGRQTLIKQYHDNNEAGLVFFKKIQNIKEELESKQSNLQLSFDQQKQDYESLKKSVDSLENRLESIQHSSNHIIVFGFYLLAATFFGVIFVQLVSLLSSDKFLDLFFSDTFLMKLFNLWHIKFFYIVMAILGVIAIGNQFVKLFKRSMQTTNPTPSGESIDSNSNNT
jgi:hypothetical protein